MFVLDANIALSWCLEDDTNSYARDLQPAAIEDGALVPTLFFWEIGNVLSKAEKQKLITSASAPSYYNYLCDIIARIDPFGNFYKNSAAVLSLSLKHNLSFYDATYLELALREKLPLATQDKMLVRAAKKSGVQIFEGS